jgi:hypothetical protein
MVPAANFDRFIIAVGTVFEVILGSYPEGIFATCLIAYGWTAFFYFMVWIIIGKYIMLHIFVAVFLVTIEESRKQASASRLRDIERRTSRKSSRNQEDQIVETVIRVSEIPRLYKNSLHALISPPSLSHLDETKWGKKPSTKLIHPRLTNKTPYKIGNYIQEMNKYQFLETEIEPDEEDEINSQSESERASVGEPEDPGSPGLPPSEHEGVDRTILSPVDTAYSRSDTINGTWIHRSRN